MKTGCLKRKFVSKRDDNVEWRRLHNGLYHSPKVIKSGRLRWAEYVARIKEDMSAIKARNL